VARCAVGQSQMLRKRRDHGGRGLTSFNVSFAITPLASLPPPTCFPVPSLASFRLPLSRSHHHTRYLRPVIMISRTSKWTECPPVRPRAGNPWDDHAPGQEPPGSLRRFDITSAFKIHFLNGIEMYMDDTSMPPSDLLLSEPNHGIFTQLNKIDRTSLGYSRDAIIVSKRC
jgi:hypothetical protein